MSQHSQGPHSEDVLVWNKQLIDEVRKKQGKSKLTTDKDRIKRIEECLIEGALVDAIDERDDDENTALHIAVRMGFKEIVKFLVEKGALTDIRNRNGETALTLAEAPGNKDMLSVLREATDNREHPLSTTNQSAMDLPHCQTQAATCSTEDRSNSTEDSQLQDERENESANDQKITYNSEHGAKSTLHGYIYQLKLLMLFVHRALQNSEKYDYWLGTEVNAADKLDDVVFRYKKGPGNGTVCRYLQAKHTTDAVDTIKASDLLHAENDFSLRKYFISYLKIINDPELNESELEDCIICTNKSFADHQPGQSDVSLTDKKNKITLKLRKMTELDDILTFPDSPNAARYQLSGHEKSCSCELCKTLTDTLRDGHELAKELAQYFFEKRTITSECEIFEKYHLALLNEIIDRQEKWFSDDFRTGKNLSEKGRKFREIFGKEYSALRENLLKNPSKQSVPEENAWQLTQNGDGQNKEWAFCSFKSCKKIKGQVDSTFIEVDKFSKALKNLMKINSQDKVIKLDTTLYHNKAQAGSHYKFIGDNVDKIAEHVLVVRDKQHRFPSSWFKESPPKLPTQEQKLYDALRKELGDEFRTLAEYKFKITNSKQWKDFYSKSELPDAFEDCNTNHVSDFIKKLVFAVNQPNVDELRDIIRKEISTSHGQYLDELTVGLVHGSFQEKMLDWFKKKGEEKGKEGVFFTSNDGLGFFEKILEHITALMFSGLRESYREVLNNYGVKFSSPLEWTGFPNDGTRTLNLVSKEGTLPTTIRVNEFIQETLEKEGIMIMLRTLLPKRTKELVMDRFKIQNKCDLLVIDCGSLNVDDSKKLDEVYRKDICAILEKNDAKKLILISQGSVNIENPPIKIITVEDEVSFDNLTKESKQRLLEKQIVTFQGRGDKITFQDLLDVKAFKDIVSGEPTDFGNAVDASTLVKLIQGDEIEVGTGSRAGRNEAGFYVSRKVNRQLLKEDIFKSQLEHEVFAIGNIDRGTLRTLVGDDDRIQSLAELDEPKLQAGKFYFFDQMENIGWLKTKGHKKNEEEEEEEEIGGFKKLCGRRPDGSNVHWIEYKGEGQVIWKQSTGSIGNLMEYKADEVHSDWSIRDHGLINLDDKVIIISDHVAMGKTTLLNHLAGKMIEHESLLWVITINLNDFASVLEKRTEEEKQAIQHDAIEYVVENLSGLETALEMEILKRSMKRDSGVVLLFDGFDEISPKYSGTVVNLLRGMKDASGVKKLFVSTRPNMREALEEELGSFSYVMEPLSVPNQEDFLTKCWEHEFELDKTFADCPTDSTRLKTYAGAVRRVVAKSINDQGNQWAGVPLQLKMLAEVFRCDTGGRNEGFQSCENFLKSENPEPLMPTEMHVVSLYDQYCKELYRRHCDQKDKQSSTESARINSEKLFKSFLRSHRRLAVYALFDTAEYDGTPQNKIDEYIAEVRNGEERVGIITGIVDNRPRFIHRSLAEYFVAKFLVVDLLLSSNDPTEKTKKFVATILIEPQHNAIRALLNELLLNLDRNMSVNQSLKSAIVQARPERGQTVQNVVCGEGHTGILKLVLHPDGDHEILRELIDTTVLIAGPEFGGLEYPPWTALCHAAYHGYLEGMKLILKYDKGCLSRLADDKLFPTSVLPLYAAILGKQVEVVEWLLKNGADPNIGRPCGDLPDTPLYLALSGRNFGRDPRGLMMVKYLVKAGADPFANRIPKWPTKLKDKYKIGSPGLSNALDVAAGMRSSGMSPPAGYQAMRIFLEGVKFSEKEVETKIILLRQAIRHTDGNSCRVSMEYLMDKLKAVVAGFHDEYSRYLVKAGADPFAKDLIPKHTKLKDKYKIGSAGLSSALDVAAGMQSSGMSRPAGHQAVDIFLEGVKFSEKEVETKIILLCQAIRHTAGNSCRVNMEYLMDKLKAVVAGFHDEYSRDLEKKPLEHGMDIQIFNYLKNEIWELLTWTHRGHSCCRDFRNHSGITQESLE